MTLAMKTLILRVPLIFITLAAPSFMFAALTPAEIKTLPPSQIEAKLPGEHPSSYYSYANRLFFEGKKDEAILWFYVGQLRYRIHLKAKPPSDPSGDPALFGSLNATLGQIFNEYAGGDPKMWATQITNALAWDAAHPNEFTQKKEFQAIHTEIRTGLEKFAKQIEDTTNKIREERKKRGLENRG